MARFARISRRIRRLAAQGRYALTPYAQVRKGIREIEDHEVLAILTRGKVVEVYAARGPFRLRGAVRSGKLLNVVVEFDAASEILIVVSTYFEER